MADTELNFMSVLDETRKVALKSDLQNLAHAVLGVEEAKRHAKASYEEFLAKAEKLEARIREIGADPSQTDHDEIRKLYNEAHTMKWEAKDARGSK